MDQITFKLIAAAQKSFPVFYFTKQESVFFDTFCIEKNLLEYLQLQVLEGWLRVRFKWIKYLYYSFNSNAWKLKVFLDICSWMGIGYPRDSKLAMELRSCFWSEDPLNVLNFEYHLMNCFPHWRTPFQNYFCSLSPIRSQAISMLKKEQWKSLKLHNHRFWKRHCS